MNTPRIQYAWVAMYKGELLSGMMYSVSDKAATVEVARQLRRPCLPPKDQDASALCEIETAEGGQMLRRTILEIEPAVREGK